MLLSSHENAGQNHNGKPANTAFKNVKNVKYFRMMVEEGRLNLKNACYYSVQKVLSSHLLSKNIEMKICKTTVLPVVLYRCEAWPLMLWEEHNEDV
jgi:hypothetical protein